MYWKDCTPAIMEDFAVTFGNYPDKTNGLSMPRPEGFFVGLEDAKKLSIGKIQGKSSQNQGTLLYLVEKDIFRQASLSLM